MLNSYREVMDYLYTQLPMFQRVGAAAYKKDLGNIFKICEAMEHPQEHYPIIHVAGTNGKGSVSHILAAMLQAHGLKTGLYTSPHYRDYRERIKVNGTLIHRKYVTEFVKKYYELFQKVKPSFFEISVALAFDHFRDRKVDIAVVETGLGGRLDSTNIVMPVLSVITNISYDHQALLGDSLAKIAGEKAGIIKPGVPIVIGEKSKETTPVFEKVAKENDSYLTFAEEHYSLKKVKPDGKFSQYDVFYKGDLRYKDLKVDLDGDYQAKNLATALQALDELSAIVREDVVEIRTHKLYKRSVKRLQYLANLQEVVIRQGLENIKELTTFIGRWQILQEKPVILIDSAHNEAGLKLSLKQLTNMPYENLHIIVGMVKDKDVIPMLKLFPKKAKYYFTTPDVPRGLSPKELRAKAESVGLEGRHYKSVKSALKAAEWHAGKKDVIYCGGSSFVVGEVL